MSGVVAVPEGAAAALLERAAADPGGFERWVRRAVRVGFCRNPVRLVGSAAEADRATGELRTVYDASSEHDGVLLVACGDRRASVCPGCAEVYRRDAWQLVNAGLRGGKGVPASVGTHPMVFATFTAPSFGPVHSRALKAGRVQVCARRDVRRRCTHGRPVGCWSRHGEADPRLGSPICADCYDHDSAVIWNALAPTLWARTSLYLQRALARHAGRSQRACKALVRVRYVKVAEFQRRGLVHYHALIRLDGAPPADAPGRLVAPPAGFTVGLLKAAVMTAAAAAMVRVPVPAGHVGPVPVVRWGEQVDVRAAAARVGGRGRRRPAAPEHEPDSDQGAGEVDGAGGLGQGAGWEDRAAGYLAKYATKSTEAVGLPARRLAARDLDRLDASGVPGHVVAMVRAAWTLGGRPHLAGLRLRRWAHCLGYRGHFATKSRAYSTTFASLRRARSSWQRAQVSGTVPLDAWGRSAGEAATVRVGWFVYAGRGFTEPSTVTLARSSAARAREYQNLS